MRIINTFDLEPWWATVPPCIDESMWDRQVDRSEKGLKKFLQICEKNEVKATFFVLGWYAKKFNERLKIIHNEGHEIGCHSLIHRDIKNLSEQEFINDTVDAKNIIEDIIGEKIISYRAPSFSIDNNNITNYLNILIELGFEIDSSISDANRFYGGGVKSNDYKTPGFIEILSKKIYEVPVNGVNILGKKIPIFGGGYLRITPLKLLNLFLSKNNEYVLYLHPHDFDKNMPKLENYNLIKNLRRNLSINLLEDKLNLIYQNCEILNCKERLKKNYE